MCGSLNYSGVTSRIGETSSVLNINTFKCGKAIFGGHATEKEFISFWYPNRCIPVNILADSFILNNIEFMVPGRRIQAIGLKRDIKIRGHVIGRKNSVKIVTRAAVSKWEASIHLRWPLVYYPRSLDNGYIFSREDTSQLSLF